jgi:hypothetical protein
MDLHQAVEQVPRPAAETQRALNSPRACGSARSACALPLRSLILANAADTPDLLSTLKPNPRTTWALAGWVRRGSIDGEHQRRSELSATPHRVWNRLASKRLFRHISNNSNSLYRPHRHDRSPRYRTPDPPKTNVALVAT